MRRALKLFARYLPPYKKYVALNAIFNVLGALAGVFSFASFAPVLGILFKTQELVTEPIPFTWDNIDDSVSVNLSYFFSSIIIEHGEVDALLLIGCVVVFGSFLKLGFTYLASYSIVPVRNNVVRDIRTSIYNKVVDLPVGYYSDRRKGDTIARITNDVTEVENSIMNSVDMLFKNPVIIVVMLGAMFYMSWQLTLFVFVLFPIIGLLIGKIGKGLKAPSIEAQDKIGEILSVIEETLGGLRIIKAFNAEEKMSSRFLDIAESYRRVMNRFMRRRFLAHPVSELLGTIAIVLVLWYGGSLILGGTSNLTPQNFIVYIVLFYSIIQPAKALTNAIYGLSKGLASMDRIDEILNAINPIKSGTKSIAPEDFKSDIVYRDVLFRYEEGQEPVLDNINLTIPKGSKVALVGQSGSGKSTFVDMLPRLWDLESGSILIDGQDIKSLKLDDLRGVMGNVNQEAILFNDTFFNNIAFGVEDATMESVIAAAKVANAHDFIMETEGGYSANIGDRGGKLSGGQRQRVSIARAVLKNPPIMILDEATSALDTESEKMVQDALENLMKNRTSIVIAHRLSTVVNADMICVFDKGQIVETGKHRELIERGGVYKKLHSMQDS